MQTLCPRIRYASVRSKPELIADLMGCFKVVQKSTQIKFIPKRRMEFPEVYYDLEDRKYFFDDVPMNIPKLSREKPKFRVVRGPHVLRFECYR